ncbi:MAG: helix-turn-helix transcriptional regulator [Kiritimatiellaeota bacterium]|nr:helix-turn-helix transcriptional regulator [Kiritimatiellota bacterium]
MFNLSISSMGVYRDPEKHRQTIHCPWLNLSLSGLVYARTRHPDGTIMSRYGEGEAYMRFGLPGMTTDFEYSEKRENWVVMFDALPLRYAKLRSGLEIRDDKNWVPISASRIIPPELTPPLRADVRRLQECFRNPVPENRLRSKLIIAGFIEFLMGESRGALRETPAGELKRLIDDDLDFKHSISEICARCDYSEDHLRVLFKEEFKMSPGEYGREKRMAKVMEYISGTRMSLKEIAAATGFEHPSHLSMAFKNTFGSTPSEAVRKYRYRGAGR